MLCFFNNKIGELKESHLFVQVILSRHFDPYMQGIDCNGHGTHCAGIIGGNTYGVAPGVDLKGVRVLGCKGSGATSDVIAGIKQ